MNELEEVDSPIETSAPDAPDRLLVCCISREERCLGTLGRLAKDYSADKALVFSKEDEGSGQADHMQEALDVLRPISEVESLSRTSTDPAETARLSRPYLQESTSEQGAILLDITSFQKSEILLLLRLFNETDVTDRVRITYSEPEDYDIQSIRPRGLSNVSIVPTFKAPYKSQQGVTLVLFLGYEGDRALATWENIEPNSTVAVIARPAYHEEWEGQAERENAALLSALSGQNIKCADSREPQSTFDLLEQMILESGQPEQNWYVAPLGTKLQTLGIYRFATEYSDTVSIVDSQTYDTAEEEYRPVGIGKTWLVRT